MKELPLNRKTVPDRTIIASQYFLYFGVLGIFLPYFNLYCYRIGFSGFEIGAISALRSVALVIFPILWGMVADRFQSRRPIYILCNFLSTGIWTFYLFTRDFAPMAVITVFFGIFFAPIISFLEAFTMDVLGKEKRQYGRVRVWGTIAFIGVVLIMGRVLDRYPIDIILVLILTGSLLHSVISLKIPGSIRPRNLRFGEGFKAFLTGRALVFLFCAFLMLVSHGAYYGFFSIHLENLGYSGTFIGIAWALAAGAEVSVMLNSKKIFNRFSLERVLIFSLFVAAIRWGILFTAENPWIILLSQGTHAITYGTFHVASILYIDLLSPQEAKTVGQAVNNAVTYGLGMMVGFFMNGYIFEWLGGFAIFGFSAVISLAGALILVLYHGRGRVGQGA